MIQSTIHLDEVVVNKDRKFGANREYYPVIVRTDDDQEAPALFTENEIAVARERAVENPEDCPEKKKTFWQSIFGH